MPVGIRLFFHLPEAPPVDYFALIIIGFGGWVSLNSIILAKNGINHGWYHPQWIQVLYQLMLPGAVVCVLVTITLYFQSFIKEVGSIQFFQIYRIAIASAVFFIFRYCMIFQVHPHTRILVPSGSLLTPGRWYIVWPIPSLSYAVFQDRLTMPTDEISIQCNDGIERQITIIPWIKVHIDDLPDDGTLHVSITEFIKDVMWRITRTIQEQARNKSLAELMERRCQAVRFEVEGIPVTWPGDAKMTFVTEHCSCFEDDCKICHPEKATSWHA
ncbi:MAG: hypothetical protein V1853_01860 [bacterium]